MMALIARFHGIILWMPPNNIGISWRSDHSNADRKDENMKWQGYDSATKDDNG